MPSVLIFKPTRRLPSTWKYICSFDRNCKKHIYKEILCKMHYLKLESRLKML